MNLRTASIVHFALRSVIVNRLQKCCNFAELHLFNGLNVANPESKLSQPLHPKSLHLNDIPLNRIKSGNQMQYVSAIALKRSQIFQQDSETFAEKIIDQWMQSFEFEPVNFDDQLTQQAFEKNLIVLAAPPGWLYFDLPEIGVATWLQILFKASMTHITAENQITLLNQKNVDRHHPQFFSIFYAHHRCCALLRQAKQAEMIKQTDDGTIPQWLEGNRLRCRQDVEWALILQISNTLDQIALFASRDSPNAAADQNRNLQMLFKATQTLSQTFQAFDAACRILGEVKTQDFDRSIIRLGLVQITQRILQVALHQLGCDAPDNL